MAQTTTLIQGRYEAGEQFLQCRFSTLFRCTDTRTGLGYLLRVIKGELPDGADVHGQSVRTQLLREGRRLAALRHRNLPRVVTTIEEGGRVSLVIEEFDGVTLDRFVESLGGPVDERLLLKVLTQLLSAVAFLHGQTPPIVHRDLRPEGIVVTPHRVVKLAEFGLARLQDESAPGQTLFKASGDDVFASPQQLLLAPSSPADDIYSLGCIAFFLATAHRPGPSKTRFKATELGESIRAVNPAISGELERIILRMMDPDPQIRFPGLEDVQRDLARQFPDEAAALALPALLAADREPPPAAEETVGACEEPPAAEAKKSSLWDDLMQWGEKKKESLSPRAGGPTEEELAKFPFVDIGAMQLARDVGALLPESVAKSIQGVCIGKVGSKEITVAVKDPTQVYIYDHISFATNNRLKPVLVRADALLVDLAQQFVYRSTPATAGFTWLEWLERKRFEADRLDVRQVSDDVDVLGLGEIRGPVVEAADRIIKEAISLGASDIHLESFELEMVVRYRIDGVLHVMETFEPRMASAVVKRIKITAGMDIAQSRICQGGRISVKVKDREFDLRVSIVPVPAGENVVMRLLNKGAFDFTLADLGFSAEQERGYTKLLAEPHGMLLVSGPTGSGKSTTLYASLKEINRPDRKILTVEDPIEYQMPGISQVQVNLAPSEADRRVTFARALREFLRQDPDVILVGEIRDSETAAIGVQAALTGHLLLSTIHTNDAPGIVTRLVDMGVEPFLVSSTLNGGIAQRLVRRICSGCKEESPMPDDVKRLLFSHGIEGAAVAVGRGCLKCRATGYKGRVGLYEILQVTPRLREAIVKGRTADELRDVAQQEGMRTLYQDGLQKVAQGQVTLEEVHRVTI